MASLPAMAKTVEGCGCGGGVRLINGLSRAGTGGVGGLCWCRCRSWLGGVGNRAGVQASALEPGQEVSLGGGKGTSSFPRTFRRLNAAGKSCERTRGGTTDKERDLG